MFQASNDQIRRMYQAYGYHDIELLGAESGYRNTSFPCRLADGMILNLQVHKREAGALERIRRIHMLAKALESSNLPVRTLADSRLLQLGPQDSMRYASLFHYLPGKTIAWEAMTMRHLKLLGWAHGALHQELRRLPTEVSVVFPAVEATYAAGLERFLEYLGNLGIRDALADKLNLVINELAIGTYLEALRNIACLPDRQLLHMDLVRGNVLYQTAVDINASSGAQFSQFAIDTVSLSGIIDFEKAAIGHPLFDIGRTLAFLLVDSGHKTPEQVRKYYLYSGYQRRGGQRVSRVKLGSGSVLGGRAVLDVVVDICLLHDFYMFLRTNPYEALSENNHFQRTQHMLLERNLVHYI